MIKVPPFFACPVCRLQVQKGRGPNGLVWHDCTEVQRLQALADAQVMTLELATAKVLTVAVEKAATMSGKELSALVGNLAKLREAEQDITTKKDATDGPSKRLLDLLRPDDPDAREDAAPVQAYARRRREAS